MIKSGDIVYFKRARRTVNRKAPEAQFKGHGIGVFLGHLPLLQPEVSAFNVLKLLGSIGFVSFDDVAELLSKEQMDTLVEKFEEKYYGCKLTEEELKAKMEQIKKEREAEQPNALATIPPEQKITQLQLVDPSGKPLSSEVPDESA